MISLGPHATLYYLQAFLLQRKHYVLINSWAVVSWHGSAPYQETNHRLNGNIGQKAHWMHWMSEWITPTPCWRADYRVNYWHQWKLKERKKSAMKRSGELVWTFCQLFKNFFYKLCTVLLWEKWTKGWWFISQFTFKPSGDCFYCVFFKAR